MIKNVHTLLFLFCFILLNAQSDFEVGMQNYYVNYLPEKVFVHTDKNIYAGGETIWAAIYLLDGQTHRPGTFSNLVRVELHNKNGEVVLQQKLLSENGHTAGALELPANIIPGNYQLTAFTNYQRNSGDEILFRKSILVIPGIKESGGIVPESSEISNIQPRNFTKEIKIDFFPEGGDCLNGHLCKVAFTAVDNFGVPAEINAQLVDGQNEIVSELKTDKNGNGSFIYWPSSEKEFRVIIDGNKKIDLPPALNSGYHLGVQHLQSDVRVSIKTSHAQGLTGARIMVHLRGYVLVDQELSNGNNEAVLTLPKSELSAGVHVITVFDREGQPAAERLFFILPSTGANTLDISTDKLVYNKRENVNLRVAMNMDGILIDSLAKGRASVSVIPENVSGGPACDDIRTWLLLNSDLSSLIPNAPELLFDGDPKTIEQEIDALLLTRGWRRFRWEMTFDSERFTPSRFLEKGIYFQGKMDKYSAPEKAQPGLVILSRPSIGYAEETETDENGNFLFGPYAFQDTIEVLLQGRVKKGKKEEDNQKSKPFAQVQIVPYQSPSLPPVLTIPTQSETIATTEKEYADLSQKSLTIARNYDSLIIDLDVVDITSTRITARDKERKERTFMYGGRPDSRLDVADMPGANALSIFEYFRKMPGVRVIGSPGNERVEMRGQTSLALSSEPSYFVDGMQVDVTYIRIMQPSMVDFIDVIRGNRAAFLGTGGTNGALLIYTKQNPDQNSISTPGLLKTKIFGFHKVRQFAVFDPEAPGNQNRPDLRTTIYWNPDLKPDKSGPAIASFKTSDQLGRFNVIVQGIRNDGRPYYGTHSFEVK